MSDADRFERRLLQEDADADHRAYEEYMAERDKECGQTFTTGGADPYGTECDQDKGHSGKHEGDDPFADGSDPHSTGRVRWNGGGSCAGDPLPITDVEWLD